MITKITTLPELSENEKQYEKLVEDFNKEAKAQGSKYSLNYSSGLPFLCYPLFMGFGNSLGDIEIFYENYSGLFKFFDGIKKEDFEAVEPILKKLKQKFEIELVHEDNDATQLNKDTSSKPSLAESG
jgi:hypothetical protein